MGEDSDLDNDCYSEYNKDSSEYDEDDSGKGENPRDNHG